MNLRRVIAKDSARISRQVVDFGLAKKLTEGRTYTLLGTPQYMAPEVVR